MTHLDFIKKFKFLKPQEHTPAVLGCFFFSVCLICSLFLMDYRFLNGQLLFMSWLKSSDSIPLSRVGFLEIGGEKCDIFGGNWVWDETYPLYQSKDCMFLDNGFRCTENGRPDDFYTKWRWQPKDCNLPRFDAKTMLEKLRDRRIVFVGDSIGRNQWESLLCMLSSVVPNKTSVYEVHGSPITKHSGSLIFKFADYNCTVEYYRAPFLVLQSRAPAGAAEGVRLTLKLDQMDWTSTQWKGSDVLIFNTGHWWNYEKTIRGGCYFQEGTEIKMKMSATDAFQRSVKTLSNWISREVNVSKTHVIFRAYAPVHFRGGDWRDGGSCHMETLPDLTTPHSNSEEYIEYKTVVDGLSEHLRAGSVELLNVTVMSSRRKDGHSSLYYLGPDGGPAPIHRQDCSHWCLPGVPDSWNELLYAMFLKREASRARAGFATRSSNNSTNNTINELTAAADPAVAASEHGGFGGGKAVGAVRSGESLVAGCVAVGEGVRVGRDVVEIVGPARGRGRLQFGENVGQTDGERVAFGVGGGVAEHAFDGGVGLAGGDPAESEQHNRRENLGGWFWFGMKRHF